MKEITQQKASNILRILYPVWMLVGMFSIMYVSSTLIRYEDATATAVNISSRVLLFRLGIVGSLITQLLFLIIPLYLYKLFKPVNKDLTLLMLVLAFISIPNTMYNELHKITALKLLDAPDQMMFYLELAKEGLSISFIFWGLWLLPLGMLVIQSGYFPKIFGWLLFVACIGYTLSALIHLLRPDMKNLLSVLDVLTLGEVLFILWLVIRGATLKI